MELPNIRIDKRTTSLLGSMTEPAMPTSDDLKEMVFACALMVEGDRDDDVLRGLLVAYRAVLCCEAFENEGEDDIELVDDGHGKDKHYTAEKIWRKYVVAGYLSRLPQCKELSEDELYDRCTWYSFPSMSWPPRLLAEVAYARGVRDALEAKAMAEYFARERA